MKKLICSLLMLCAFFGIKASAQTLEVSLPQYQITINGQTINNNASEYPFLEYKNILYFPLTYNMCEFVGLETHFAQKGYTPNSPYLFYVGRSQKANSDYVENPSSGGAQSKTAEVVQYDTYIQTQKYSNNEYPLINYKGVTYLPMVWNVAAELLDWEYSFSGKVYRIETQNAVRPKLDYLRFWNTSPKGGDGVSYIYGKNFYIQYPNTIYGGFQDFVFKTAEKEIRFNLAEELQNAEILSLGTQKAPGLYGDKYTEHIPLFDGQYFVIICTANEGHAIIKVDMLAGTLVYADKI